MLISILCLELLTPIISEEYHSDDASRKSSQESPVGYTEENNENICNQASLPLHAQSRYFNQYNKKSPKFIYSLQEQRRMK